MKHVLHWSKTLTLIALLGAAALVTMAPTEELFGNYHFNLSDAGNTTVEQVNRPDFGSGKAVVTTVGLGGIGEFNCGGNETCHASGLHRAEMTMDQDLRIVIDVIHAGIVIDHPSAGIKGRTRGVLSSPALSTGVAFKGKIKGNATCVGGSASPCGTVEVDLQARVSLLAPDGKKKIGETVISQYGIIVFTGHGDALWTEHTWDGAVSLRKCISPLCGGY